MKTTIKTICVILLVSGSFTSYAQETVFQDLSYPFLEKLIDAAKRNYPEVRVRQSQTNIAKSTYHQSHFGWLDSFTASYIYSPESAVNIGSPTIFKGYQLIASVSLGSLFERPYTIHNTKEAVKIAELQESEYALTIEAQIKRYYFSYIAAQAELRSRVNAVLDATNSSKQLKYTYEKGETSFQTYNEALTNLYNQNSFRVQAELAVFTAKTNLEELLGAKLESIK